MQTQALNCTPDDIKTELRLWIERAAEKKPEKPVTNGTQIIALRLINSLQIMDLLLFIEQLSGRPVQLEALRASSFASVDAIYRTFFSENDDA